MATDVTSGGFIPLSRGVWGILATPFDTAGGIDHESIVRQVALYRQVRAAGVVGLGVFGEAAKLDSQEKQEVVATVTDAAGELPVVVGLATRATAPVIEEARLVIEAARTRLAGLMVQVHSNDPDVVAAHFAAISQATSTGIVVQDYPLVSGVHISADTLATAVIASGCAVAVKAESPPTPPAIATLSSRTDLPVFGGLGGVGLIDELSAGASGAMTGFSYPEGLVAAVNAWFSEGFAATRLAWERWLPLANFEAQAGIGLPLRKEILRRRGVLTTSTIRHPGRTLPKQLMPLVDQHLAHLPAEVE